MRKLQKELLNKKMSLHQALMSMDILNPDIELEAINGKGN